TPGAILGTAGYMAPEQVRGQTVTAAADIFSFGAVFYEMLCGRRAFPGDTPMETVAAILRDQPTDPLELRPEMPPALAEVVRTCLAKRPDERYRSARDLLLALDALGGLYTDRVAAPALPPRGKHVRRAAPVLAVAAAFAGGWLARPRPPAPAPA